MSNKWRSIGASRDLTPPFKEIVENIETGERRTVLVSSNETIAEAIARGKWENNNEKCKETAQPQKQIPESSSSTNKSTIHGGVLFIAVVLLGVITSSLWFNTDKQVANITNVTSPIQYQNEPETFYVNTQQIKIRAGAGIQYRVLGKISYGEAVVATETAVSTDGGNWAKVKVGNFEGWINKKYLTTTPITVSQPKTDISSTNAEIPKQFHGKWTEPKYCNANSDAVIEINNDSITGWESGCKLKSIAKSDDSTFSGTFDCSGEGESSTEEITLIQKDGKLIYKQPPELSRCNI